MLDYNIYTYFRYVTCLLVRGLEDSLNPLHQQAGPIVSKDLSNRILHLPERVMTLIKGYPVELEVVKQCVLSRPAEHC